MKPQYLRIKNWEKFQHYKGRRPPWVKFHVELLDDYELIHLPICTQLVYDRLLLLAAKFDNRVPNDPSYVASLLQLRTRDVSAALENLLVAGFIAVCDKHDASNDLADVYARDRDRLEAETQELSEQVQSKIDRSLRSVG